MTRKNDISTPEGYFQNLEERLKTIPTREVKPTVIQRVSPWIAYAASLAVLAAVGNFIFGRAAAVEEDAEWDYVSYLSQSLDPDGQIELVETVDLTDDEIRSFLIASNISVEQLALLNYEEDYQVALITAELDLTEAEAQALKDLKNGVEGKDAGALLDQYEAAKKNCDAVEIQALSRYKKVLPAEKVAKLLVAEEKFRHQQIGKLGKGEGRPHPGDPGRRTGGKPVPVTEMD